MISKSIYNSITQALTCGVILTSCATNPIYSEFEADETSTIVRALRCEVRQALYNQIANVLRKNKPDLAHTQLADRRSQNGYISDLKPWDVDIASAMTIMRYYATGISYKLVLNSKDEDKSSVDSTLTKSSNIKERTQSARSMMNLDQTRQGERQFGFSENFGDYQRIDCSEPQLNADRNLLYPIKGRIGIEGTINAYIELSSIAKSNEVIYGLEPAGLAEAETLLKPDDKSNVMTDELTFTTVIGGSIVPTLILEPVAAIWRSTSLSGSLGRTRTSMHKITVGIAQPRKLKPQHKFAQQLNCLKSSTLGEGWEDVLFAGGPDACRKTMTGPVSRRSSGMSAADASRENAREAVRALDALETLSRTLGEEIR